MTKAEEKIIESVRKANKVGALCGLSITPTDSNYDDREHRFVKRLANRGMILYVHNARHGGGWVLPENLRDFHE